jgi:hypothetical protein
MANQNNSRPERYVSAWMCPCPGMNKVARFPGGEAGILFEMGRS